MLEAKLKPDAEELIETLRSIGLLCHDINNPLTTLLGRAQILKMRAGNDESLREALDAIEESSLRIAATIKELAEVARTARTELAKKD